jgi:hypothetical protein
MNSERLENLQKMLSESLEDPFLHYAIAMEYNTFLPEKTWQLLCEVLEKFPDYLPTYFMAAQLGAELGYPDKTKSIFQDGINLAKKQANYKSLNEIQAAYQNYLLEFDE